MIYSQSPKLDFNDVLILPNLSPLQSRAEVNLYSEKLKKRLNIDTCGIIAANMDGVGTFEVSRALSKHGCMTALSKHLAVNDLIDYFNDDHSSKYAFYTLGKSEEDLSKFKQFVSRYENLNVLKVCLDVANGYMTDLSEYINKLYAIKNNIILMSGNVVDNVGISNLGKSDIIKMGIGPGANCLTREVTGIGYPHFSCIYDSVKVNNTKKIICSDGGCTSSGDIVKAFAAGANMVMLGSMLAGTDQGGGEVIDGSYVKFYGMSSKTAQQKHGNGIKNYRASEGRTTMVPYKGDIGPIIEELLGGIRSACTYVGASHIDELTERATFIQVNSTLNRSMEKYTVGN